MMDAASRSAPSATISSETTDRSHPVLPPRKGLNRWHDYRMLILVAIVGTAILASAPALTVNAENDAPVALAGDTTVRGTTSAYEMVYLPHSASVSLFPFDNKDFQISGSGRLPGLVLEGQGTLLFVYQEQYCWSLGCVPHSPQGRYVGYGKTATGPGSQDLLLPAGRYGMYLLADGAPVIIRLHLHGLTGTAAVQPSLPAEAKIASPTVTYGPVGPVQNLFFGGGSAPIANRGLVFEELDFRAAAGIATNAGACLYQGAAPPPGPFVPGCPSGGSGADFPSAGVNASTYESGTSLVAPVGFLAPKPFSPGIIDMGAYYQAAGVVTASGMTQMWLNLKEPPSVIPTGTASTGSLPNTSTAPASWMIVGLLGVLAAILTLGRVGKRRLAG